MTGLPASPADAHATTLPLPPAPPTMAPQPHALIAPIASSAGTFLAIRILLGGLSRKQPLGLPVPNSASPLASFFACLASPISSFANCCLSGVDAPTRRPFPATAAAAAATPP